MRTFTKQLFTETLWLLLCFLLTLLLALPFLGGKVLSREFEITVHNKTVIIQQWIFTLPLYLLVTFIVYFIKTFRQNLSSKIANRILVAVGILLILLLTMVSALLPHLFSSGFTLYPPLSQLGPDQLPRIMHNHLLELLNNILMVVQLLVLVMLLVFVYQWGTVKQLKVKMKRTITD